MLAHWFGTGLLARAILAVTSAPDPTPAPFTVASDTTDTWGSLPVTFGALSSAADAAPDAVTLVTDPAPDPWAGG